MFVHPKSIQLLSSEDKKLTISLHPKQRWELTGREDTYVVSRKNVMLCLSKEEFERLLASAIKACVETQDFAQHIRTLK